jgi:hypothetical protein
MMCAQYCESNALLHIHGISFHIDYIVNDIFRSNILRTHFCISLPTLFIIDMQHVGQQYSGNVLLQQSYLLTGTDYNEGNKAMFMHLTSHVNVPQCYTQCPLPVLFRLDAIQCQ